MAERKHARIDRRSRAMHQAIARKLAAQPELLNIARDNIARWLPASGNARPYLEEWQGILDRPLSEILALIVEESEHMTALRQSTPFAGVLTPKERWAIYAEFAGK